MKMNERMKKALSILLCVLMLAQYVPTYAFAATAAEDGLCEHHTEHTADCGYEEGVSDCANLCDLCLAHDHGEETTGATEESTEPSTEAAEPSAEPAPVCDCGTDDEAIHATNCAVYVAPENPVCRCAEKCTETNIWCDICGGDYTACTGQDMAAV